MSTRVLSMTGESILALIMLCGGVLIITSVVMAQKSKAQAKADK